MAETLKILAQAAPAGGVDTALGPPGAGKSWAISHVAVANTSGAARTFRLHACIAGAVAAVGNALDYNVALDGLVGEAAMVAQGATLGPTDLLRCRSDAGNVTFTVFGAEVS